MESVKILIANKTMGSGKSTLSLALAYHICNASIRDSFDATIFDCSETQILNNKRIREINNNDNQASPFQIIPLQLNNDILFTNTIENINEREAIYLFDISSTCSDPDLFKIIYSVDVIVCPVLLSEESISETQIFIDFVNKAVKVFREQGYKREDIPIFIIPNIVPPSWGSGNDSRAKINRIKSLFKNCSITPNIPKRDHLLNQMSTFEMFKEFDELFHPAFDPIYDSICKIYKSHKNGNAIN